MITKIKKGREVLGTFISRLGDEVVEEAKILTKSSIKTITVLSGDTDINPRIEPVANPMSYIPQAPKYTYAGLVEKENTHTEERTPARVIKVRINTESNKKTEEPVKIINSHISTIHGDDNNINNGFNIKSSFIPTEKYAGKILVNNQNDERASVLLDAQLESMGMKLVEDAPEKSKPMQLEDKIFDYKEKEESKIEEITVTSIKFNTGCIPEEKEKQSEEVKDTIDFYTEKYGDTEDDNYNARQIIKKTKKNNLEEY